jgi:2-methylcitrate dehydratase PrpD
MLVKQVDIPKGDPRDPMDAADLIQKIIRFAVNRNKNGIDKLAAMIMDIENLKDIQALTKAI